MDATYLVRIPDRGVTELLVTFADDFVLDKAGQGESLLDIGCGRGVFTEKLTTRFKNVIGIDIVSEELFSGAKEHRKGRYLSMDAHQLGFKKDSFDTIISRYTFHHLNLQKSVAEVKRCLKPRGTFIMIDTEETFWKLSSRICYFLFGVYHMGILKFLKIIPDLLGYFFTKETLAHRREDILRLKKESRFNVNDFIKTYTHFFPGAEVGVYRWAGYVFWQKPA